MKKESNNELFLFFTKCQQERKKSNKQREVGINQKNCLWFAKYSVKVKPLYLLNGLLFFNEIFREF